MIIDDGHNFTSMCHAFLDATVKKYLKLVYIFRCYRKIKTGLPLFWNTLYMML